MSSREPSKNNQHESPFPLKRRDLLRTGTLGIGSLALSHLLTKEVQADGLHHPPRAKNVIFLYMDGGPSQVDSFDPKPRLQKDHGKPFAMKIEPTQFNNIGKTLQSPWKFKRYGECGLPVSDLFPHVGRHADKLCVVRRLVGW